jgi:hypothetical protein
VRAMGTPHRVVRLTQPVDVERFRPLAPLPERPRVALALGNYVAGPRAELLRTACARHGIELRHVGLHGDTMTLRPEVALNQADVVFGKARVIAEAMACGRAAYVFDHNGGEGWVTDANRAALAADNFGGQEHPIAVDAERLADDLARYDPASGLANRDHVVAHHAAHKHAARLVEVLREIAGEGAAARPPAPYEELARMVRLYQRADGHAFAMQAEAHRVAGERDSAHERAAHAQARAAHAEGRVADAEARAARAEHEAADARAAAADAWRQAEASEDARRALIATRRWRAVTRLLRPLDRMRQDGPHE